MRKDMFKVIVERPRLGGNYYRHKPISIVGEAEDLPKYESMTMPYNQGHARKQLNENLSPLIRFLDKQVGRPWDSVWSELCEYLDSSSAVKKHVKDHASDFVDVKIRMINGVAHTYSPKLASHRILTKDKLGREKYKHESLGGMTHNSGWVPLAEKRTYYANDDLYVNPDTNLLTQFKRPKQEKYNYNPVPKYPCYKTKEGNEYRYLKGIWYYVEIKTVKRMEIANPIIVHNGEYIKNPNPKWVERTTTTEIKQQLNKKDKRRLIQWIETGVWGPPQKKERRKIFKKI